MRLSSVVCLPVAAAVITSACCGPAAAQSAFHTYGDVYRSVPVPPIGPGSFDVVGDALPDGRIVALTGNEVYLESAVGSGEFHAVATLDPARTGGSTDPSFLRISPDGASIAVGAGFGRPVAVFATGSLGSPGAPTLLTGPLARYYDVPHYDGAWADNGRLAITSGVFGSPSAVTLLDVASDPGAPSNPAVITNIAGSPGGIAVGPGGWLFTGNGFALGGGSATGTIKAFSVDEWAGGGEPADFETGGVLIGAVLSGNSLALDAAGNLFVGGGDFISGDAGYLGVVNSAAVAAALMGLGPIDPSDPEQLRRLDPLGTGTGFFSAVFNDATGELYITDGGAWFATVPAPGAGVLALLGVAAARRRCRAR